MGIVVLPLRVGENAPHETAIVRSVPATADRRVMTLSVLRDRGAATVRAMTPIARSALTTIVGRATTIPGEVATVLDTRTATAQRVPPVIVRATTEIVRSVPSMTALVVTTVTVRLVRPVTVPRSRTVIVLVVTTASVRVVPRVIVRATTEIARSGLSTTVPVDMTESVPRVRAATVPMGRADDLLDPTMAAARATATTVPSATMTATVDLVAKTNVRVVKSRHPIVLVTPSFRTRSQRSTCTLPRGTSSRP